MIFPYLWIWRVSTTIYKCKQPQVQCEIISIKFSKNSNYVTCIIRKSVHVQSSMISSFRQLYISCKSIHTLSLSNFIIRFTEILIFVTYYCHWLTKFIPLKYLTNLTHFFFFFINTLYSLWEVLIICSHNGRITNTSTIHCTTRLLRFTARCACVNVP